MDHDARLERRGEHHPLVDAVSLRPERERLPGEAGGGDHLGAAAMEIGDRHEPARAVDELRDEPDRAIPAIGDTAAS